MEPKQNNVVCFFFVLTGLFFLCLTGCSVSSDRPLKVDPRHAYVAQQRAGRLAYLRKERKYIAYLFKEAKGGNADAQYALGYLYYYGRETLPQDMAKALFWIHRAAHEHHPAAKTALEILGKRRMPRVRGGGVSHVLHLTDPVRRRYHR